MALLIAAIAARQFDASQVGEVELDNGFERLGGRAALQTVGKRCQPIGIRGLQRQQLADGVAPALRSAAAIRRAAWTGSDRRW